MARPAVTNVRCLPTFSSCRIRTWRVICWPAMSRATHARRPCAAPSSNRIDLEPSRRAAVLAYAWLCVFVGVMLGAIDLPLLARLAICICAATPSIISIQSVFLLRGPRAVQALGSTPDGHLYAFVGRGRRYLTVVL